jgi:tRNA-dihydrouridine synthase B
VDAASFMPISTPTIGSHLLRNNLFVAPMAGVTDRPFRQLCKRMGAGYAVSEMVASNAQLWKSEKTLRRANHTGEVEPISVQIAGADPQMLADAARHNVANGAQIIDIPPRRSAMSPRVRRCCKTKRWWRKSCKRW